MEILLAATIVIIGIFIGKLWIEYINRENSFHKANQIIDRELLGKKYIDSEMFSNKRDFYRLSSKTYRSEQLQCIGPTREQSIITGHNDTILYISMSKEVSVKGTFSEDDSERAYRAFCEDVKRCRDLHIIIFSQFESNKEKNYPEGNRIVISALEQDIDNTLSFLHDLYQEQNADRFKYIDINRFKSEEFKLYLQLKVFYFWLVGIEKESVKKTTNKSKTLKSISKKEISDETKSTEKESNNGVTNVKRRRTRTSNSSTKKSTDPEQKNI